MSFGETTARARELGAELRRLRKKTGYTSTEFAKKLGWAPSTVSRVETGVRGISEVNLVHFAAKAGASWQQVNDLQAMWRVGQMPGCWLTDDLSSLVFHESTAIGSVTYNPLLVPGMLQTENYAATLNRGSGSGPDEVKHWVAARMERQVVLRHRKFDCYIHEQALRLPIGNDELMNEQMIKLLLLAEHPLIDIRVVPTALGAESAFPDTFTIFHFADARPLVFLEHGPLSLFIEDRRHVASYCAQVAAIAEDALDRGQSRELLAELARDFDLPKGTHDPDDNLAQEQPKRRGQYRLR